MNECARNPWDKSNLRGFEGDSAWINRLCESSCMGSFRSGFSASLLEVCKSEHLCRFPLEEDMEGCIPSSEKRFHEAANCSEWSEMFDRRDSLGDCEQLAET